MRNMEPSTETAWSESPPPNVEISHTLTLDTVVECVPKMRRYRLIHHGTSLKRRECVVWAEV